MSTATLIREARIAAGLSQAELARRAGTSQPTVSAYERGRIEPTLPVLRRFADVLHGRLVIELDTAPAAGTVPGHGRGHELIRVLELASHFPARHAATLQYPKFGPS